MKKLLLILLTLTSLNLYSQLEKGTYYVCLDYCYFPCHGQYYFNFQNDNKCTITWADDVTFEKSDGYYYVNDSSISLKSKSEYDSIKISLVYDEVGNCENCSYLERQQPNGENLLWLITLNERRLQNIKTTIFQQDNKVTETFTDSLGYVTYRGNVADSITFVIQNKTFSVRPSKNNSPSFYKVYIDTHYKDLFDRIKELKYDNKNYWYIYECDNGLRRSLLRKKE